MKQRSKVFLELIQLHSKNPKRTKELLQTDRRMTHDERNIIRGFLLMRDNLNSKAFALASSIKTQTDPEVEAMRLYLLGGTLNNQGKYRKALEQFKSCYLIFPKNSDAHLEFVILNNLFVIQMNLHQLAEAREIIAMMKLISHLDENDSSRLKRLEFGFCIATEDSKNGQSLLNHLFSIQDRFPEQDQGSFLIQVFNYGIVFDQFELCDQALSALKDQKKYVLTQNYNYMKMMLQHLRTQSPFYLQEEDFKDHPALLAELKFIRALDQHKYSEIPSLWKQLHSMNPEVFKEGYRYEGFKTVFSRCLNLHESKLKDLETRAIKESNLSILDAIELKLKNEQFVTKEQLFYYLYGRELESKVDQNRISKLINKLKTTRNLEIESMRGAYQLVKKAS